MSKDKFRLRDMDAELGQNSTPSSKTKKSVVTSPVQSSVHGRPRMVAQSYSLPLPVSQREITCRLMELDPGSCFPSPLNKRVQALLSADDPRVAGLLKSVSDDGQREPVLARPINKSGGLSYEVIYGTTRLFVATELASIDPAFRLKAWVADVPEVDLGRLANAENENRRDISPWEEAIYLQTVVSKNSDNSLEYIAEQQGISKTSLLNYLDVARIPEKLVRRVPSPQDISVNSGVQIWRLLKGLSPSAIDEVIKTLEGTYLNSNELLKSLKQNVVPKQPESISLKKTRPLSLKDDEGKVRVKVAAHRNCNGQFKIDLFNASDKELELLLLNIRKVFKCH